MKPFAELLERLLYSPGRKAKLAWLTDYFARAPDPDRGLGLAALTGDLDFKYVKPAVVRELVASRVDPVLFRLSFDFIGDLAEATALIWPGRPGNQPWPRLAEVHRQLIEAGKAEVPELVAGWLDALDATGRWALLKLLTGRMRVGVSARLAKLALAKMGCVEASEVEEVWHGLKLPYQDLFGWLEGGAPRPSADDHAVFRPLMLANPLSEEKLRRLDLSAYVVEWKWDGIRVQLSARAGERRLYSRSGDDISHAFPEIIEAMNFDGVLDGELLVMQSGELAPFHELQKRLNWKRVTAQMLGEFPAHVRLYDLLFDDLEDLRGRPYETRRARLESFYARLVPDRMDLSALIAVDGSRDLTALRESCRDRGLEGLMLKRRDSIYTAGRPVGPWYKWKRDPLKLDTVLMYAQRGLGQRYSFYSDFTLGAWCGSEEERHLVPVGKVYFGATDAELRIIDKWVRDHTVQRFGPVREVEKSLVIEAAFDSVQSSSRHKSGLAMRFLRVHRIRWDKLAEEADELEALQAWID